MFAVGLIGFGALATGPIKIGGISFDTNTMLLCAASMIMGFQAIFFAIFTQAFSIHNGLLKPDSRIRKFLDSNPVEWGVVTGGILFIFGAALFVFAFLQWQRVGFGELSYAESLRLVIPAVTAMAIGVQTFFCGFVFGALGLTEGQWTK